MWVEIEVDIWQYNMEFWGKIRELYTSFFNWKAHIISRKAKAPKEEMIEGTFLVPRGVAGRPSDMKLPKIFN